MLRSQIALLSPDPAEGGVMTDEEFQKTIRRGINSLVDEQKAAKSAISKVLEDTTRFDKEIKTAGEELTKIKNTMNDFDAMMKKMAQIQKMVARQARSSFGNPVERALQGNDELRFAINALCRFVLHKKYGIDIDPAHKKYVEEENQKFRALTGVDTGLGQATVPQATFNEIYDTLLEYGEYSTLGVTRVGMRTNVLPIATARPQFYWIGAQSGGAASEGSTITSGAFTGGDVLLYVQTLAVLMYVARELLADSTVDLAPYVLRQMAESIAQGADTAAFIGTGNADQTNGGYVGLFNAPLANANLAAVANAGNTTVGALQLEDFVNVLLTVSPIVLRRKARWWMHPQIIALCSLIRDKMGRPIFQTFTEVPAAGIMSIYGYPITPTAIAPSVNAAGQPVAAFGDPDGVCVGIRADLELATSEDIGFPQNLMAYRTLLRAGVKIKTLAASTTLKPVAVLQTAPQ